MTAADFVAWAQGYYGPYPQGQRADVAEYLHWIKSEELDELKAQMLTTCPSHIGQVNGYPPDIEAMDRLMPEVRREIRAQERAKREREWADRMLPAPGDVSTSEELMRLDWSVIFRKRAVE